MKKRGQNCRHWDGLMACGITQASELIGFASWFPLILTFCDRTRLQGEKTSFSQSLDPPVFVRCSQGIR
ncbi:Tight Junction Protein Zo-2 [Manis pentadactyla]|nr:Tight Junction Protein Zo-2 [Manis pentadactyla]